jgi:hypothetical protein
VLVEIFEREAHQLKHIDEEAADLDVAPGTSNLELRTGATSQVRKLLDLTNLVVSEENRQLVQRDAQRRQYVVHVAAFVVLRPDQDDQLDEKDCSVHHVEFRNSGREIIFNPDPVRFLSWLQNLIVQETEQHLGCFFPVVRPSDEVRHIVCIDLGVDEQAFCVSCLKRSDYLDLFAVVVLDCLKDAEI